MPEPSTEHVVVVMTAATLDEATRIAEVLVAKRLAACVQILPQMTSIYVWQGEMQRESEHLLMAKSTRAKFDELEREVRTIHSYETPEIIALPIINGSSAYLDWLSESLN